MANNKNTAAKSLGKALDEYLKKPSGKAAEELKRTDYYKELKKRLKKAGPQQLVAAIDLLRGDEPAEAADLLAHVSMDDSHQVSARLAAFEALEERGADFNEDVRGFLIDIEKIAASDDAEGASKFFPFIEGPLTEAFASAVVEHKATGALKAAGEAATEKSSLKTLRKAAHILNSRGVKAEEIPAKVKAVYKPPEKEKERAYISQVDGHGMMMLAISLPSPGGVSVLHGIVDEEEGLKDCAGGETSRRGARSFKKRLLEGAGAVEADVNYISYLFDKAAAKAAEKGRPISPDYTKMRHLLPKLGADYKPPNTAEMLDEKPTASDARALSKLFDELEISTWVPPLEDVKHLELRLGEIEQSQVIVSDEQEEEQIKKAYRDAARKYLAQNGPKLVRRLEIASYVFYRKGEMENSRRAIATAGEIRDYIEKLEQPDKEAFVPDFAVEMFRRLFVDLNKTDLERPDDDEGELGKSRIIIP